MKSHEPRVLQLIDSLNAGGAERMSVNLANALAESGIKSFLCTTRQGGTLEQFISQKVQTIILYKKSVLDIKALFRLIGFIKEHKINIIHAHSSSFFTALLCKPFTGVKIVWHLHNGNIDQEPAYMLKKASYFFDYVISVNMHLLEWAKKYLYVANEKIVFLQNFAELKDSTVVPVLPGTKERRIVCLANLRYPKDHMTLLNAFKILCIKYPEWHLLLVGQDNEDTYSTKLKSYIEKEKMEGCVHILGSRSDTADILQNATIGVLSSESEGLPVALLEYGLASLPVVCTDVGQCAEVLAYGKYGKVIPMKESERLAQSLLELIEDIRLREKQGKAFHMYVLEHYSKKTVIKKLLGIYERLFHD